LSHRRLAVDSLVLAHLHLLIVAEKLRLGQYNLSWWVVTVASPAHRRQWLIVERLLPAHEVTITGLRWLSAMRLGLKTKATRVGAPQRRPVVYRKP
jgi:hypothetical protein